VKLSDFGLSTGFHKQHDSKYYQRLLESANSQTAGHPAHAARNSVMVTSINLTMTSKDQIATWKANRRKLVHSFFLVLHCCLIMFRHIPQLVHLIILLLRYSCKKGMVTNAIGGHLGPSCSNVWLDTHPSAQSLPTRRIRRSCNGSAASRFPMTFILVKRRKT